PPRAPPASAHDSTRDPRSDASVPPPLPLDTAARDASPGDSSPPTTSPPISDSTSPPSRGSAPRLASTPARSCLSFPTATSFEVISLEGTFLFRSRGDIIDSRQQADYGRLWQMMADARDPGSTDNQLQ